MSQRKVLRGKRRAGVEASDDEQSEEEQHRRQRYPRSPSSHTKRKSMYNHVYGIVGRDTLQAVAESGAMPETTQDTALA